MADLGGLDCAAGTWVARLRGESKLPPRSLLETFRRREVGARERAEALADAEQRCSRLAQEQLQDERALHHSRERELEAARADLTCERQRRADAEAALDRALQARCAAEEEVREEAARRAELEAALLGARRRVEELRGLLADDRALDACDEFRAKLDRQREEAAETRRRIDELETQLMDTRLWLQSCQGDLDTCRQERLDEQGSWGAERAQLSGERLALRRRLDETRRGLDAALAERAMAAGEMRAATEELNGAREQRLAETLAWHLEREQLHGELEALGTKVQGLCAERAAFLVGGAEMQRASEALLARCASAAAPPPSVCAAQPPYWPTAV